MKFRKEDSFTLIELLIAITIFSIIGISVYSTFHAGISMWRKASPVIEINQSRRVFFDMLSSDLKNAILYYSTTDEGKTNFEGKPQRISFWAAVNVYSTDGRRHAELAKISYQYDKNKVIRKMAQKNEGFNENNGKSIDMLDNIDGKDFGFEYCYREGSDEDYTYKWTDTWEEPAKIPRAARIKLENLKKTVFIPTGVLIEVK